MNTNKISGQRVFHLIWLDSPTVGNRRPLDGDCDGLAAFDTGDYEFDARSIVPQDWFTSHGLNPADPHVVSGNPDHGW